MLDYAHDLVEVMGDFLRYAHSSIRAIHNVMPAIGDVWHFVRGEAQRGIGAELFKFLLGGLPAEGDYFHRNRNQRAEAVNEFRFVRDDDHAFAGGGNDFFTQQCAAVTLD